MIRTPNVMIVIVYCVCEVGKHESKGRSLVRKDDGYSSRLLRVAHLSFCVYIIARAPSTVSEQKDHAIEERP